MIPLFSVIPNATFAQMEGKFSFTMYLYRRIGGGSGIMNHESIKTFQNHVNNLGIMNLKVFVIRFGNHE